MAFKRRSGYWVKTEVTRAAKTSLQHLSKNASIQRKAMSKARYSLASSTARSVSWLRKRLSGCPLFGEKNQCEGR